jgi:hypothetical protein
VTVWPEVNRRAPLPHDVERMIDELTTLSTWMQRNSATESSALQLMRALRTINAAGISGWDGAVAPSEGPTPRPCGRAERAPR